ncbi:MAG: toll/interleukin-1 receptor domain-containing protein [Anaerolineae bacterium]|nr:toll/interleukin-1 receptor domain-containing protein [Anaerolineae bacterium]MCI0608614.1 toll/interleukin-1 receptor domain-containing protein [Anaerolineae bacterium]
MASLFISYSRKDIEVARKLTEAFKGQDLDFWIDWEGIPPTVDWWKEIEKGIEEANIFLFLISPDSAGSIVCKREIEHAAKNGKRLIPVVVHDIKADESPTELKPLNWIFLREQDSFDIGFNKLITAIKTDYEWAQTHRQLQVKALEWERSNKENSFLLRGKELQDAEFQLDSNTSKEPHPTDLQREYVLKSRHATDRQRRRVMSISVVGTIIIAGLAYAPIQNWLADPILGEWEEFNFSASPSSSLHVAMNFKDPDEVYVVDQSSGKLYVSGNSGLDWSQINVEVGKEIIGLSALENSLYILTLDTVWFSPDKGGRWEATGNIPLDNWADLLSIGVNPNNEKEVYVGDNNGTVYHSSDSGTFWDPVEKGYKGNLIRAITTNGIVTILATEEGLWVHTIENNQWDEISLIGCSDHSDNVRALALTYPYSNPPPSDGSFGFLAAVSELGVCDSDSKNMHGNVSLRELHGYKDVSSMVLAGQADLGYEGYITANNYILRKRIWYSSDIEWWISIFKSLFTKGE